MPDISQPETDCGNTATQPPKRRIGRPFTGKGDPRNNLKGRPRHFDDFRRFGLELAQKEIVDPKTGDKITFAEALIRKMATSDEPALIKMFCEYTFGKVPDKIEGTGFTAPVIVIKHAHEMTEEARQPAFEPSGS